jgi:hypothetical protein
LDREDDHGEKGESEEADRGQEKGCSGAQEEKSGKDDSEEDRQEGHEESGTEESGTEESGTEAQGAGPSGNPGTSRSGSVMVSVFRRFEFRRRRQQLAVLARRRVRSAAAEPAAPGRSQ